MKIEVRDDSVVIVSVSSRRANFQIMFFITSILNWMHVSVSSRRANFQMISMETLVQSFQSIRLLSESEFSNTEIIIIGLTLVIVSVSSRRANFQMLVLLLLKLLLSNQVSVSSRRANFQIASQAIINTEEARIRLLSESEFSNSTEKMHRKTLIFVSVSSRRANFQINDLISRQAAIDAYPSPLGERIFKWYVAIWLLYICLRVSVSSRRANFQILAAQMPEFSSK